MLIQWSVFPDSLAHIMTRSSRPILRAAQPSRTSGPPLALGGASRHYDVHIARPHGVRGKDQSRSLPTTVAASVFSFQASKTRAPSARGFQGLPLPNLITLLLSKPVRPSPAKTSSPRGESERRQPRPRSRVIHSTGGQNLVRET